MSLPSGNNDGPEPARDISHGIAAIRAQHLIRPGFVVWLTGLSGAGKTTIAVQLERRLRDSGLHPCLLDGDALRRGLCKDLGFSAEDRRENIRRAGEVARLLADAGLIAICAFISPFREDRDRLRASFATGRFFEVYVNAPVEICEQRDVKGLYARARAGLITDFTGVSAPYEPPPHPEVELRTDRLSVAGAVDALFQQLIAARH